MEPGFIDVFSKMILTRRKEYEEALQKTQREGRSKVSPYIEELIDETKKIRNLVEKDPLFAETALQAAKIIIAEKYPQEYINMDFSKLSDFYMEDDLGRINVDNEICASKQMCKLLSVIAKAAPSLKKEVYDTMLNIPDCSERVYFSGSKSSEAINANAEKRKMIKSLADELGLEYAPYKFGEDKIAILVDQFEMQNKGQIYVFYKRSKDKEAPNQSFLLYAKTKDCEKEIYSPNFDKKETQVLEASLDSQNEEDKKALHKFIVGIYAEEKSLTEDRYKELFSPLENIYYSRSKLAKVRNKSAKLADRLTEKFGLENVVKKVTGGKKIEEVKINSKIKALEKTISDAVLGSEITKEQILSHNIEKFKAHFNDGEGDIFVYPHECVKAAEDGKKHGYIYRGVYQGADLLGVKVYESENVELNEFKNIKALKNRNGKDLFSLDELVEFDYAHTQKIWKRETFHASPHKKQATKEAMEELINRRLDGSNKR